MRRRELIAGDIRLDTRSGKVTKAGEPVKLTAQEYKLLSYLMHHKGKVVSRTELIEHIYDQDFDRDSNTIEVFVTRIRKKLGADVITTIRGLGYSLEEPAEADRLNEEAAPVAAAAELPSAASRERPSARRTGSLTRRMIGVAALWIVALLLIGGFALDRVLRARSSTVSTTSSCFVLNSMIGASEIGPDGEVRFNRPPADQRFIEPYSGLYFQISGAGADTFPSRSLWDRRLRVADSHNDVKPHLYDSNEFSTRACRAAAHRRARRDPARIERPLALPGRAVARDDRRPDPPAALDLVLELHRAWRRLAGARRAADLLRPVAAAAGAARGAPRSARARRPASAEDFPAEIRPLTEEINQLLAHSEAQAEEARRHAGNLAHALKTPLTVITNAATAHAPDLADTVCREALVMRRQVDHHLARARAIGRRASAQARARVWDSLEAVQRAVDRLYEGVTVDIAGDHEAAGPGRAAGPRRNARQPRRECREIWRRPGVRDGRAAKARWSTSWSRTTGPEFPSGARGELFARGARLDTTGKPGTGLGLAIVRDVAEIYGGTVSLEESEDLGGLLARLTLPAG